MCYQKQYSFHVKQYKNKEEATKYQHISTEFARREILAACCVHITLQHKPLKPNAIKCSTLCNVPSERAWTAATCQLSMISYTVSFPRGAMSKGAAAAVEYNRSTDFPVALGSCQLTNT